MQETKINFSLNISHRNRSLYSRMGIVIYQGKVIIGK